MDLVEVSPNEHPPVCRIMDYGKQQYEKKKRQKQASQSATTTIKEIRLRPKTDTHDRDIKLVHARGFLEEGHKVQFTMLFRGRERMFRDRAVEIFREITDHLGEGAKVERPPFMDGRRMTMVLAPGKRKGGGPSEDAPARPAVAPRADAVPRPVTPPRPAAPPRVEAPVSVPEPS